MADSAPHPMFLGASGSMENATSGISGIGHQNNNNNDTTRVVDHETLRFDTIDAITTLYASKLMDGYSLTDNGEVCFRCHMPLMQREQQRHRDSPSLLLPPIDESSASITTISGPKRICVVCHEEWGSADSFEQKLVVFSALQAAQLEGDDDGTTTTTTTSTPGDDDDDDDDNRRRNATRNGASCRSTSVTRRSNTAVNDSGTNQLGHITTNNKIRDKYTIPPSMNDALIDDDITLVMDDLNISPCKDDNDNYDHDGDDNDDGGGGGGGGAKMNIEVTLRTRCKSCAMDLPISDQLYNISKEESLLYYPRGATECPFCCVVHVAKLGESSTIVESESEFELESKSESESNDDNFDLLLIQANLDKMDVKEDEVLHLDADDKSVDGESKQEHETSVVINEAEEVYYDDYKMMEPIMEADGAEVRLMMDWKYNRDHAVLPSAEIHDACTQKENVSYSAAQKERGETESVGMEAKDPDDTIQAYEEIADMQPQNIHDAYPTTNQLPDPPLDKTKVVKGLIANFLQQNLLGQSNDDGQQVQWKVQGESNARTRTTPAFTRDPPTTELDPPATTDAIISSHVEQARHVRQVEKEQTACTASRARHVRHVENEQNVCIVSRGMDPPETDIVTIDSRDVSPTQQPSNTKSTLEMRESIVERWFPSKNKFALLKPTNDDTTHPVCKIPIQPENESPTTATKRVNRKHFNIDRVMGVTLASKFHAKKKCNMPIRNDGEPCMSEDDVRDRLAQLQFQFTRKDTIGKESFLPISSTTAIVTTIASLPSSSLHLHKDNNINDDDDEHSPAPISSSSSISSKQRLPLSPTAAARHRRIKEDLIARKKKAMSLHHPPIQSSLVSIE